MRAAYSYKAFQEPGSSARADDEEDDDDVDDDDYVVDDGDYAEKLRRVLNLLSEGAD